MRKTTCLAVLFSVAASSYAHTPAALLVLHDALVATAESAIDASGNAAGSETEHVWLEPGTSRPGRRITLQVHYPGQVLASESIVFDCEIRSDDISENAVVRFVIADGAGTVLHEDIARVIVDPGVSACRFAWSAGGLADGTYTGEFELGRRTGRILATHELTVRKISLQRLTREMAEATSAHEEMVGHLQSLAEMGLEPPYACMRAAIAKKCVEWARESLARQDWRRADDLATYIQTTASSMRARLAFGNQAPGSLAPIPQPDLSRVEVRNGGFYAEGRPVFLFGAVGGEALAKELDHLRRYGLNLAVLEVGCGGALADEAAKASYYGALDEMFQRAKESNVSVSCALSPWSEDAGPFLSGRPLQQGAPAVMVDTNQAARQDLERALEDLAPYLARQDMLNSLSLVQQPRFKFEGEQVCQEFIAFVEDAYPSRDAVNLAWKTRFAKLDEVQIWQDYRGAAYHYDWRVYHQRLGTLWLSSLMTYVRDLAPDIPLQLGLASDLFEPGQSRSGLDHETLAQLVDISGCTAERRPQHPDYAMAFPQQTVLYTLLRSLAPAKPLFNSEDCLFDNSPLRGDQGFAYAHSAMWEAVMAGLNASAAWRWVEGGSSPDTLFYKPYCLEGYATACLDINRLAEVVLAFQQAPADVAILWSAPSTIYNDGSSYLASLQRAFEGCSFAGRKLRFITERQCAEEGLAGVNVLVIPELLTIADSTFRVVDDYICQGGIVVRTGTPIPYDARGQSRQDVISYTERTILVRGNDTSSNYLHAMDEAYATGTIPPVPRAINRYGYPLEGVRTQYVEIDGQGYLYLINLRSEPVRCCLYGDARSGRDLIQDRSIHFPTKLDPLEPMLIQLDMDDQRRPQAPVDASAHDSTAAGSRG